MENCEYWQDQISALLDGELSAEDETALLAHLDGCGRCRTYYDALTALAGTLERDLPAPPAELTGRIMDAVRAQAAPKEEKKTKVVSFARYVRPAALAAAAALVIWAGARFLGPKGLMGASSAAPQAAMSAVTAAGADEDMVFAAEEPAAAQEETAFSAESYAADTEIWEDAAADAAPAEAENGLAVPAPESRDAGTAAAYVLYHGGEPLARGELDAEALRRLLTAEKPAPVPDRAADYTLTLSAPDGEEIWYLWEEDSALLCRRDGESETGWTLSADVFREMFGLDE